CYLVSRIGRPITEPQVMDLKLRLDDPDALPALAPRVAEIARAGLEGVATLWRELIEGPQRVW
ncbi:MAG TPA: methionine adenosyltransferase, partial [Candidatus Methylomirabilis sp.]|nr:methionine adenosyltransferase [Candidatus Methylomirabilis sp.]